MIFTDTYKKSENNEKGQYYSYISNIDINLYYIIHIYIIIYIIWYYLIRMNFCVEKFSRTDSVCATLRGN